MSLPPFPKSPAPYRGGGKFREKRAGPGIPVSGKNGNFGKPGLDIVAHAVLTAYHVKRKRAALQGSNDGDERRSGRSAMDGSRQAAAFYGDNTSDMQEDL
ncbi:hypothetical protein [Burkholderia sp. MSMB2157WGS]|uniref:hypothetical protein n=1 Tax=Burkholderia sp. MSMB2157WGS TaxID=1637928 RepID=UPI0015D0ADAD|nr:hypothetical protein [Burkholderia sp. MSMB2157WGS]